MNTPVLNKQDLLLALATNSGQIIKLGVKQLGFFGSFARNTPGELSDIDFYVEFEEGKKNFDNFMDLADLLEEITGRKIELLTPESLNKHFGHHILKEVEYVNLAA